MTHIQNISLNKAYQLYLNGKRAQLPFSIFNDFPNNQIVSDLKSLENQGYIENIRFGISYADFQLTELGVSFCASTF